MLHVKEGSLFNYTHDIRICKWMNGMVEMSALKIAFAIGAASPGFILLLPISIVNTMRTVNIVMRHVDIGSSISHNEVIGKVIAD